MQRPSLMPAAKYLPYQPIGLADRTWPDRVARKAPLWCSVDLRDGNQALIDPMDVGRKRRMFDLLVSMGFKEIEVGYPTASRDDHDFVRHLIEDDAIPDDVVVQVMAPIRQDFIDRTVHCLRGVRRAVLQVFNPTSEVQRRLVLRADRDEVRALALNGAEQALRLQDSLPGTELYLQYAPESYTQTEPGYALDLCNTVLDFWAPRARSTLRVNLPATVEVFPPQEFADRIEYTHRNLAHRDRVLLSVHPHNDRGSGVAAAELAVLAGADRVEGTLFGNGERTGNVCLVTLAMNLLTQGVDPMLDLREIDRVRRIAEDCTHMPVPPRHPWAGDFVYTSFAGTHQDAISKGLRARQEAGDDHTAVWEVPYLPVDPRDIGRDYQALIRVNTQSGKGGIAHLLRRERGLDLPRRLQIDFAAVMQRVCERAGGEISAHGLWLVFEETYALPGLGADPDWLPGPVEDGSGDWAEWARTAVATAPVEAAVGDFAVARAGRGGEQHAAYCELTTGDRAVWGVGIDASPAEAARRSLRAAVQRARTGPRAAPARPAVRQAAVPAAG
ncbi:2-isopropylmalate synthase [Streptomyces sp. 130]|uniref:2-isopropylmalate synthase n=1 Tax=Streptomyces sp. 130 TaxID=2591006 RepID=UPI0021B0DBF4|nr:2-isopropylmalate synthase [Streptomyces sp. 130]